MSTTVVECPECKTKYNITVTTSKFGVAVWHTGYCPKCGEPVPNDERAERDTPGADLKYAKLSR